MHPFIKLLCLLVLIAMLVALSPERVLIITSLLALLVLVSGPAFWLAIWRMVWRMKWFWLSLLILYGWFIPGSPVFSPEIVAVGFMPSVEGLQMGLLRGLALLDIISSVVLIMKSTQQQALIVSIIWLLKPLYYLKINTQRFAARLVLTLESVTTTESVINTALKQAGTNTSIFGRGIDAIAAVLVKIEKQAAEAGDSHIVLPELERPGLIQWFYPCLLFAGLYWL